jgi:hypothetical protein
MPTHAVEVPNGDIFVADGYGQNRIHRFSARGEYLLTCGGGDSVSIPKRFKLGPVTDRPGTDPCQFNVPHALLVTADNLVYVMDRENHRWQIFTTDGAFVSLQEHVSHPNRVALDADGTFHVAGGAGIESSGSAMGPRSAAGGRRAKRRASSSPALSCTAGGGRGAPHLPPGLGYRHCPPRDCS